MLYLMHREPELVERTRWFMEPVDYLTMRFTGVASATHASRIAAWLTDNRHLERFEYDAGLLRDRGHRPARLPPAVSRFGGGRGHRARPTSPRTWDSARRRS